MATYVIIFKKPEKRGDAPKPPISEKPITDIKDYHQIRRVFQSKLLSNNKFICSHSVDGIEQELIYNKTMEGKRKVCFTGIKFTDNTLRRDVPDDRLDKDTIVYFIDSEQPIQPIIDMAHDGDVISLIDSQTITSPLKCDEDKRIVIDLCGCDIKCEFEGEVTTSPNITIKNSIEGLGSVDWNPDYSTSNNGFVHLVDPIVETVADAVSAAAPGDVVVVPAGEYAGDITIENGITISAAYNTKTNTYDEVVLSGNITINSSGTVEFNHVKFANNRSINGTGSNKANAKGSAVKVDGDCDLTLVGCSFEKMDYFYSVINIATSGKVLINDITFDNNKSYHEIEWGINVPVLDGTTISNCKFLGKSCYHNHISMYCYEEGATVNIIGNHFDYSGNAVRFSNSNNANVAINIEDNTYLETDSTDATTYMEDGYTTAKTWAGLFFFQQYTETMDLSGITVNAKNNKLGDKVVTGELVDNYEDQLYYTYMDKNTWTMTRPTVNIVE